MPMTSFTWTSRQARTHSPHWIQASRLTDIATWLSSSSGTRSCFELREPAPGDAVHVRHRPRDARTCHARRPAPADPPQASREPWRGPFRHGPSCRLDHHPLRRAPGCTRPPEPVHPRSRPCRPGNCRPGGIPPAGLWHRCGIVRPAAVRDLPDALPRGAPRRSLPSSVKRIPSVIARTPIRSAPRITPRWHRRHEGQAATQKPLRDLRHCAPQPRVADRHGRMGEIVSWSGTDRQIPRQPTRPITTGLSDLGAATGTLARQHGWTRMTGVLRPCALRHAQPAAGHGAGNGPGRPIRTHAPERTRLLQPVRRAAQERLGLDRFPGPDEFLNHMPRVMEAWRQAEIQGTEPYQAFTARVCGK